MTSTDAIALNDSLRRSNDALEKAIAEARRRLAEIPSDLDAAIQAVGMDLAIARSTGRMP